MMVNYAVKKLVRFVAASFFAATATFCWSADYPDHPTEIVVPWAPGGGTDSLARAFAESAKKQMGQSMVVTNKPGATGSIGFGDVARSKPDGYKIGMLTVELLIVPHLGISKITFEDFVLIARLNADPAALTVSADAPWNSIEEFLAHAKKKPGEMRVGNSGVGSIWHLAAAALQDKAGAQFNHVPFQGANPAVLALLGGHLDAVTVSPAEVSAYLASGKLKMLAVMSDKRVKGFDAVPTLKERKIDLAIGAWRGLGVVKGTPQPIIDTLKAVALKAMSDPAMVETMDKLSLNASYADDVAFKSQLIRDSEYFRALVETLKIKN